MSENTANNLNTTQEQAQEDADNLQFFLETTFAPDILESIDPNAERVAVETLLLLYATELTFDEQDKKVPKAVSSKETGLPESRPELSDVTQDPLKRFNKAVSHGKGRRATYSRIDGFREDALKESRALNRVATLNDSGKVILDVPSFRKDREAIYAVADYLQAREFAARANWPARNTKEYKDSQKYWRGCMLAAAQLAGPSILGLVAEGATENAQNRMRYWTEQIQKINQTVGGKAVRAALARDGGNQSTPDQASKSEAIEAKESESSSHDFRPPPDVQVYLSERRKEFESEFDRLDSMGMPEGKKQRILTQKFPEIMLPDREVQQMEADRQQRLSAAARGGSHPKGPRGKKHIFDDRSQSVKSEYETFGK